MMPDGGMNICGSSQKTNGKRLMASGIASMREVNSFRWLKDDSKWYYLKRKWRNGHWLGVRMGKWYYLDVSERWSLVGFIQGQTYHLKEENGEMSSKELVKVEGGWYYVNEDGSRSDKPAFDVLPDGLIVTTK